MGYTRFFLGPGISYMSMHSWKSLSLFLFFFLSFHERLFAVRTSCCGLYINGAQGLAV